MHKDKLLTTEVVKVVNQESAPLPAPSLPAQIPPPPSPSPPPLLQRYNTSTSFRLCHILASPPPPSPPSQPPFQVQSNNTNPKPNTDTTNNSNHHQLHQNKNPLWRKWHRLQVPGDPGTRTQCSELQSYERCGAAISGLTHDNSVETKLEGTEDCGEPSHQSLYQAGMARTLWLWCGRKK